MNRCYLSAAVMSVLSVAYQGYAHWFDAITALEEPLPAAAAVEPGERPDQQTELGEIASRFLPDLDWPQHATYSFERKDSLYIYADSADPVDDGEGGATRIVFAPFAMIIPDPDDPEAEPYVVRSESARIRFENPFRLEFDAPKPGRLVGGNLDGAVAITGPDGLEIYGQNFVFSEESAHLYSYYPVSFAFGEEGSESGRQRGSAQQLEIELISSHEGLLGRDGPQIGGVARIVLRHDVRLDLTYEQDDDLAEATISARGLFEYDVASRVATFEDDVVVRRPTSAPGQPPQADVLRCDWLALQFETTPDESVPAVIAADSPDGKSPSVRPVSASISNDEHGDHLFGNLRFRQLRAQGDRAVLRSDENRFQAAARELHYDGATRRVRLVDDELVRVWYDSSELQSPEVEVVHDEEGDVISLDCRGAGQLERSPPEGGPPRFRVFWEQHMGYGFDPESGLWLIQADGSARVVQTGEMGIQADQLAVWVDPEALREFSERNHESELRSGSGSLPVRYAQGTGHVIMASPAFRILTDRLQATISSVEHQPPAETGGSTAGPVPHESGGAAGPGAVDPGDEEDEKDAWTLQAHAVQVQIAHSPQTDDLDVTEATAVGDVLIRRDDRDGVTPEDALSITGDALHLDNRGEGELLTLAGAPAQLHRDEVHLEARDIVFDRARNTAHVDGRGMLRFPVSTDLNGQELDEPVPLDVHWQEQMTFDGLQAQFFGNVVLKLNDGRVNESRLYCEDLNVLLNRSVSFAGPPSGTVDDLDETPIQFTRVRCQDGVRTELYEWEGTRLTGIRVAELAEFTLEHDTGILTGLGPGVIRSWARDAGGRISIAPDASAEANQPADSDQQDWVYTQVHFSRNMTGNARQRSVELHGRVRAIYAPVQHPREVFTRDELSGESPNAEDAIWLGCDQLAISLHNSDQREDEDYAVFGATGHCELEGKLFRAVADLISFDQSKKLFTLKSLGDGNASIYYQRSPGEHPQRLAAQIISFIPSKQHVSLQRAAGFQTAP